MRRFSGLAVLAAVVVVPACTGPISTMRSPYHLRTVEVRNETQETRTIKIEPAVGQQLGASTTFTGLLAPGEVKTLYLYHGLIYEFRIMDEPGFVETTRTTLEIRRDTGLAFVGDSLVVDVRLAAQIGEPTVTFSDSLQRADPFGLRGDVPIMPDTSRQRRGLREREEEAGRRPGRN